MAEIKLTEREYELIQAHVHSAELRADDEWGQYDCFPHDKPWVDCKLLCKCGHGCNMHVAIGEGDEGGFLMCCSEGCDCRRTQGPWEG